MNIVMAILATLGIATQAAAPAGPPNAAAPPAIRLTLDEAIERGLAASHRLAEVKARGEAAEAATAGRHAATLPQLAAQAGYTRTNHITPFGVVTPTSGLLIIYPDVPDNYRTRLDMQWPIYTGGRLDALERAARAEATATQDDLAAARADLRLEITRAYWALVTAGATIAVVDESVKRMEAHLQDVRNQLNSGLVPPNEVLSVEAQVSRQRMLAIQARSTREVAEADLGRLIGADSGTPLEPASTLDGDSVKGGPVLNVGELIAEGRAQRNDRAALTRRIGAAQERARAASSGNKPTVALAGGIDYARPNPRIFPRKAAWNDSWDASINVNWPVFDGGRSRAELTEAAATARAAEERLAEFDTTLAVEIAQRVNELTADLAAIDAASDAVRSATEARRVVGERFTAGVATSTDVLDAQVALLQVELDRTQAIAASRLAQARLARAVGR
jgi:outer membrane protein